MKIRCFIICLLLFSVLGTAFAQFEEKGFFVEMNVGYGQQEGLYAGGDNGVIKKHGQGILTPTVGYQINDRWAVGVKAQFETGEHREFITYGMYVQYAFLKIQRLKIFADGGISRSVEADHLDAIADPFNSPDSGNYTELGMTFGVSYNLAKHLSVMLRYPYIGYSENNHSNQDCIIGDGRGVIDLNIRRLQIGLQWVF